MKTLNILLIEDNPGDAFLVEKMLSHVPQLHADIAVCNQLSDGINWLYKHSADLILLDLSLPDSHGLETVRAICQHVSHTPVIVLTGLEDEELGFEAIGQGAQDYLIKGTLNAAALGRTIRYAKERHRLVVERENLIQELDSFAHTVAHDLKNPLGVVMGYASYLHQDQRIYADDTLQMAAEKVIDYGRKMNNIIDELLLLARVRDGDVETHLVDMARVVSDSIQRLHPMIKEYSGSISYTPDWPLARGYEPWLEEVWVNFMSNALKYGGRPPKVELGSEQREDGMVYFWVKDNGKGLSSEEASQLFVPFSRLGQVRVDGHGLGLSIVQRIINRLGGQVFVQSELGKGSCFGFALPAD